jgi:hypothetical protein
MSNVINFLDKKREKERSEAKTFCVALGGYDEHSFAYGLLFVFPTKQERAAREREILKIINIEVWKCRLVLAGMPRSDLRPPTVSSRRRELIFQGWIENFSIVDPPVEIVFVMDFIEEVVRRAGAVRLEKDDYFNRFGRKKRNNDKKDLIDV